jgi:hypothetical protein
LARTGLLLLRWRPLEREARAWARRSERCSHELRAWAAGTPTGARSKPRAHGQREGRLSNERGASRVASRVVSERREPRAWPGKAVQQGLFRKVRLLEVIKIPCCVLCTFPPRLLEIHLDRRR